MNAATAAVGVTEAGAGVASSTADAASAAAVAALLDEAMPRPSSVASPANNQEWSTFTLTPGFDVNSMMFYKDELHLLCPFGDVLIYSFVPQSKLIERGLRSVANITGNYLGDGRFVESSGELLLIMKSWATNKNDFVIKVFKRAVETDEGWTKMESLGDRMLLISWNTYACLNTQGLMGSSFVANSIYVADTFSDWQRFCLKDESWQTISPPCNFDRCEVEWIAAKAL